MGEYVMVFRGQLREIANNCACPATQNRLDEILAKSSEQHQGEPVAWMRKDGVVFHTAFLDQFGSEYKTRLQPLYTRADPGEGERLRGIIRMHEKTVQEQAGQLAHMRDQLAERDERIELHVKRRMDLAEQITGLHRQIKQLRATLQNVVDGGRWGAEGRSHEEALKACAGALANGEKPNAKPGVLEIEDCTFDNRPIQSGYTLGATAGENDGGVVKPVPMSAPLREAIPQLAERDALLKEAVSYMRGGRIAATSEADMIGIFDLRQRIEAALSASAEPSAPKCKCDMRTKLVGDGCAACNPERAADFQEPSAPVEPLYPKCTVLKDANVRYSNSTAAVEIDERAEFEKRFGPGTWGHIDYTNEQIGWKCRAALEKKS